MADDDRDLYEREKGATKGDSGDGAGADEQAKLDDAGQARASEVGEGPGGRAKGIRGRLKQRRTRMLLGFAGAGGASGLLMGGFLFFGPTYGLVDMVGNLTDLEFGPTNKPRGWRQARILSDFARNGRDGVIEGRRSGRYRSVVANKWRDINMNRLANQARAQGWTIEFDPNLRDAAGRYVNTRGRGNTPPAFDADGNCTNCRQRVWSRVAGPGGSDIDVDYTDGSGRMRQLDQDTLRLVNNTLLRNVYDTKFIGAAQRVHYRGFANVVSGFRWGKFFSERSGNALFRAYNSIFNPRADVSPDGDVPASNADGSTNGGSGEINQTRRTLVRRIAAGFSPREVMRGISIRLGGNITARLAGGIGLLTGLASLACLAEELFSDDVQTKYTRYESLMAYGAFLLNVAGEIRDGGTISLEEVGTLYNEFISYKRIAVDDSGNWVEIAKTIGSSASIQRANGKAVIDGEELAAENYLDVQRNAAYNVFAQLGSRIGAIPGSTAFCGALNSTLGQIFSVLVDLVSCIGTGGATCAAGSVASEVAFAVWGDDLLNAVFGLDLGNALGIIPSFVPQSAEIAAQAFSLACMESDCRGGIPVSSNQYNDIRAQYLEERQEEIKELPFTERYFALSTPGSLGQELAFWRMDAQHRSFLENAAHLLRMPFDSFSSLFSSPAHAQVRTVCYSINDWRRIEADGVCDESTQHDNFNIQKYSYDVIIQCDGRNINLLSGTDVDNPDDDSYGINWVEEQVQLIISNGYGDDYALDCPQFGENDRGELAREIARVCHGLIFPEPENDDTSDVLAGGAPYIDLNEKHSYYSDPNVFEETVAQERNDDVRRYCVDNPEDDVRSVLQNTDNRQLYALIGRYVDDIILTDGMKAASGGWDD